ncbi:putative Vicianin hydrolase [Hibiscus syriacus]|uniref:Vicianin hydrolase n=1 Tax=Hibiscus syriacus TaxID=106335 RepID=A0A6A2YQ06_HIBSY|nr:putative Vicianin hydrolase [Hibiscus syriacus]
MSKKRKHLVIFLLVAIFPFIIAEPVKDKQALLDFLQGVTCNCDHSSVIALRLPGVGLRGPIPANTLGRISAVEIISLRSNGISGSFPSDFVQLKNLTTIYLQFNKFSGTLPDFSVWNNLTIVDLSYNGFIGSIPPSVSKLAHLTFDLANNNLTGIIPKSLERFPSWAFSGNNLSSENALRPPALSSQPPNAHLPSKKAKKLPEPLLLGVIIGGSVLLFMLTALLVICCRSTKRKEQEFPPQSQKKEVSLKKKASENHYKNSKLVFFEGCNLAFDLEDLLRASAEVLGKGTFGVTYKAALRGRYNSCSKKDEGRRPLDWETRLRITIGAAKGIAYIHAQNNGKLVHGNIKASNIFLNSEEFGCVSDIGLAAVMSPMPPTAMRVVGYRAPEVTDTRKTTQASDVYSYGVLLLELLTGKSPIHASGGEEIVQLVRWVHFVVREEWTAEVFDVELLRYPNNEEEMVQMLQIRMSCVVRMPEQRPKMSDVAKMIEYIWEASMGNQPSFKTKPETSTSNQPFSETKPESSPEIIPSSSVPSSVL